MIKPSGRAALTLVLALALAAPASASHHGRSTLGKPKSFPIPAADVLQPLATGDVSGDGRKDIVIGDFFENRVYELDGKKGTKAFAPAKTYDTDTEAEGIAVADVTHDQEPDIISTGSLDPTSVIHDIAYPSYDEGTFSTLHGFGVTVADINHDGNRDILTADFLGDAVGVLLGTPTGVSGSIPHTFPTPASPLAVVPDKIDNDQADDLAVLENSSDLGAELLIMRGDGSGAFSQGSTRILNSRQASGMVAGRFNGDKRLDLAVADCAKKHADVFLLHGTKGGFKAPQTFKAPEGTCPNQPAAGDVNGDGRLDVVLAVAGDTAKHAGSVEVLYGTKKGLSHAHRFRAARTTNNVAVADLNGDGRQDVIAADRSNKAVAVLFGKKR